MKNTIALAVACLVAALVHGTSATPPARTSAAVANSRPLVSNTQSGRRRSTADLVPRTVRKTDDRDVFMTTEPILPQTLSVKWTRLEDVTLKDAPTIPFRATFMRFGNAKHKTSARLYLAHTHRTSDIRSQTFLADLSDSKSVSIKLMDEYGWLYYAADTRNDLVAKYSLDDETWQNRLCGDDTPRPIGVSGEWRLYSVVYRVSPEMLADYEDFSLKVELLHNEIAEHCVESGSIEFFAGNMEEQQKYVPISGVYFHLAAPVRGSLTQFAPLKPDFTFDGQYWDTNRPIPDTSITMSQAVWTGKNEAGFSEPLRFTFRVYNKLGTSRDKVFKLLLVGDTGVTYPVTMVSTATNARLNSEHDWWLLNFARFVTGATYDPTQASMNTAYPVTINTPDALPASVFVRNEWINVVQIPPKPFSYQREYGRIVTFSIAVEVPTTIDAWPAKGRYRWKYEAYAHDTAEFLGEEAYMDAVEVALGEPPQSTQSWADDKRQISKTVYRRPDRPYDPENDSQTSQATASIEQYLGECRKGQLQP